MIKFLTILLSPIILFSSFNMKITINPIQSMVINEDTNFVLEKSSKQQYLLIDDKIIKTYSLDDDVYCVELNDQVICLDRNENYSLTFYSQIGNIEYILNLDSNFKDVKIKCINNILYLYGSVYKDDGFYPCVYCYNEGLIEISILDAKNSSIFDLVEFDDKLIVIGSKDDGKSNDTYNVKGCYLLCYEKDEVINKVIFEEDAVSACVYDKTLLLSFPTGTILLDASLNVITGIKFGAKSVFSHCFANFMCLAIIEDKVIIYDVLKSEIIGEEIIIYNKIHDYKYIYIENDKQYYLLDAYDKRNVEEEYIYAYQEPPIIVSGLYDAYYLKDIKYEFSFSALVNGSYSCTLCYANENSSLNIDSSCIVLEEENVSNGNFYPKGYQLAYTGKAKLNGKNINQLEPIKEGKNILELRDKDDNVRTIEFYGVISNIKIEEEKFKHVDAIKKAGETISIEFIKDREDINIDNIIINGKEAKFRETNDRVFIDIEVKKGLNLINIEEMGYVYLDHYFKLPINKLISIMGEENNLRISSTLNLLNDMLSLDLEVSDEDYQTRNLMLEFSKNGKEENLKVALNSNKIDLSSIENGHYSVSFYYCFSSGQNISYYKLMTLSLDINDKTYIALDLKKVEKSIKEATIYVKNNSTLKNINYNGKDYTINSSLNYIYIAIGFVFSTLIIAICAYSKKRISKKKNK